jgi:hypothetical protein
MKLKLNMETQDVLHIDNFFYEKDVDVVTHTKIRRLEWAGHMCGIDRSRTARTIL